MSQPAPPVLAFAWSWCYVVAVAVGGEVEFGLTEHLGLAWRDELVSFAFEFPAGECHPESLRLQGPNGPVPVQIVTSRAWPEAGGLLRSATIAFFADLEPLGVNRYRLSWQADPAAAPPAPPSSLKIGRSGALVAVASHAFGAVFRTGGDEFAQPVESAEVPGPLREMLLPDGRRFGGSELYGPSKVVAWSGEMTAEGPVFADLRWRYRYADGTEFLLRGRLGARDTAIYWDMSCKGTLPRDGWRLLVTNGLPPLSLLVHIENFSRRKPEGRAAAIGDLVSFPVAAEPPGRLTSVTPWADWTDDYTQTAVILAGPDGSPSFFAASRDPGAWIEPHPDTSQGAQGRIRKSLPVMKRNDGLVTLEVSVIDNPGGALRRWTTGVLPAAVQQAVRAATDNGTVRLGQRQLQLLVDKRQLNRVKDFVLDWPESPDFRRPMMIVDREDIHRCRSAGMIPDALGRATARVRNAAISALPDDDDGIALAAWLFNGSPQMASDVKLVERLRQRLGLLGNFDLMRSTPLVALLYDGVVDSGLVSEAERRLLRARMAYLGYRMEDPATWSNERGFNTSLPNMDVSMTLGKGVMACALPDHPRAVTWITPALAKMDEWLDEQVGTRGEWMEGAHYDHVTASMMLAFVIAAKNSGFRDYSRHEKFQLLLEYIAKQYTPPDPTRGGLRVTPPLGRANAGVRIGIFGVMARLTRDTAPAYSAEMQWAWQQSGSRYEIFDNRLGGLEYLYIDPNLPARQPDWGSEWFPLSTVVMRNRFGRPGEDYVSLMLNPDIHFARGSEIGAVLQWYAFGVPVAGAFTGGYAERHELLTSRVVPAAAPPSAEAWRKTNFHRMQGGAAAFFTQPGLDYLDARYTIGEPISANWSQPAGMPAWPPVARGGMPPIPWRRQLAFIKGAGKKEAAYLVFRDTIDADQPTLWQFWTWSDGIRDAAAAGSLTAPQSPAGARALAGRRFTAVGQHGVDLDFFVLSPPDPNAFTLRWGTHYTGPPDWRREEIRDLIQLRQDGQGSYTIVAIPRLRGATPSTVVADQDARLIRILHTYGEDLVVFGAEAGLTSVAGDTYATPVGCLQTRGTHRILTLGPTGRAIVNGKEYEVKQPTEYSLLSGD